MPKKSFIRRHKIISAITGLFLVLVVTLAALIFFFPEGFIRHTIGAKGSSALGRDFSIDGPLKVTWDWTTPTIHAEKIRISNWPGSPDKDMVSIDALDVKIKIWNLLRGRMVIPSLSVDTPRIVLEKKDATHKNWDFPTLSKANVATGAALPQGRHDFPILDQLNFKNGSLIYRDAVKKLDVELKLDVATGDEGRREFKVDGKGKLQDQDFTIAAVAGSLNELRDSRKPFPLDLTLTMGATKIAVKGTFDDPVKMKGVNATLELSGHNLADLFYLTGIPLPPSPAYKLSGALKKNGDVWDFNDFSGLVGGSDLTGDLSYDLSRERGLLKADLHSKLMDIDDLGGLIGLKPKAAKAADADQKADAAAQKASTHLLPDVPINLDRLRSADMDVTLKVDKIHAPGFPFEDMDARFLLDNGVLKIDPLKFNMAAGAVDGGIVLDGSKNIPDVKTNLDLKRLSLAKFFGETRFAPFAKGHLGGHIELAGKGKTLADVMAVSNGRVVVLMSGGTISKLLIRAANLDVQNAPPLFVGKDEATEIRCAIADFKVTNGLLTSQIFNVDTTASNIEAPSAIDLKSETIDAKIVSHAKDPSLAAGQIPVVITGPLKHPSIGLDPVEAGARGGAAAVLGTLLTPLAAVIPFIDMGLGEDSNCGDLIAKAKADQTKPANK